jgi:hypothetical protein
MVETDLQHPLNRMLVLVAEALAGQVKLVTLDQIQEFQELVG